MGSFVADLAESIRSRSTLPLMPDSLTLDEAYAIQKQVVALVAKDSVSGLKAGMTAKAGQEAFGLTHPLIGSLYSWGELKSGAVFDGGEGVKLECEIGIVVDGDGNPQSAGPVVEVPRMEWARPEDAVGTNLTATNIAADRYIVGEQKPWRDDYSDVGVVLTRDGEVVCEAPVSDALGGPHDALQWMLEEGRVRELNVVDGMLLITGACGGIHPAEPGKHVADYGAFGRVEFTVR